MNKNLLIVGILVVLVIFSSVQAFQLRSMKVNVDDLGTTSTVKPVSSQSTTTSGSSGSVPTNLQNLPGMVGGC